MASARMTLSPTVRLLLHYSRTISQFLLSGSKLLKLIQVYTYLFMPIYSKKIMSVLLLTEHTTCLLASSDLQSLFSTGRRGRGKSVAGDSFLTTFRVTGDF